MAFEDELTAIVAALCFWADRGDEEAALELNALAETYPPEVMLAAAALKAEPLFQSRCIEWEMLGATVDLIAAHYRLPEPDVWSAVFELERELLAETKCERLSDILQEPRVISTLGERVARKLIGPVADVHPALVLGEH